MDLLVAANSVPFSQAATAPSTGTAQYAGNGNYMTGQPPTEDAAYQMNAIMIELISIIQRAGITLDRTNNTQVLAALATLFGPPQFVLTGTTSVTVPVWATRAVVEGWGGGGGGGASLSSEYGSGGGGGGGYSCFLFTGLTGGAAITVSVAAGGTGGTGGAGNNGGVTTWATVNIANGGVGSAAASTAIGLGGAGAAVETASGLPGTSLLLAEAGSGGQNGLTFGSTAGGGMGGASPFGGGSTIFPVGTGSIPGNFPGGGASGSADTIGSAGAPGLLRIRWLP